MDYQSFKNIVIDECAKQGIAEYELYYQSGADTTIGAFRHEINEFSSSEGGTITFRAIIGGKMGKASTESLCEAEARAVVARALDNASVLETSEQVFFCEGGKTYHKLEQNLYELPTTEEMISRALDCQDKLYATDPLVIDGCQSEVISEHSEIALYNSKGLDLHWENNTSGLVTVAVVSDGKEMANSFEIKLGKLDTIDSVALTAKAVKDAKQQLGGDVAPTGQYPVVFDPSAMSSLLGVYASIFSSENVQKGLSKLAGMEGQSVAAPCVNLIDDPFHPENPARIHFDREGCPTYTKNVIENGVLKTLLYNMKTAAVAGKETTGNSGEGTVRPFTMYLAGGEMTEEELLQKAGNGVYITDLGGLHAGANPITGDFSLQSSGFMIENGVKTDKYVKSFTVAGNFYELLKNITALANNSKLPRAMGSTTFGAPTTLVDGLSVAGK